MSNWKLDFFYESAKDENIKKDLDQTVKNVIKVKNEYYQKLSNPQLTPEELKKFFEEHDKALEKGLLAIQFAHLNYSRSTINEDAQKLFSLAMDYETKIDMELSFWKPVLLKQSEEKLKELMNSEELKDYKHVIEKLIQSKEHILSEEAERVISALDNSSRSAFGELYGRLTNSYEFQVTIDGQIKEMTGPQVRSLRMNPDKEIRKNAMNEFFNRYEKDKIIIENIYSSIAKHYDTESKLRNFKEPISMRNLANEVDDEIIKTVIDVTTKRTPMVHKYYKWKGEKLGIDMTLADIYAPMSKVNKEYTFEESKKIVLESYYEFDEEVGKIVESFFDEGRIDSEIKKGKRGGAFCSYIIPNYKPFVLMNFTGNMRDVMTLAHELGHGVHGTLSSDQNMWNYHTPLTMAEVASVFGEMLVMDKVLPNLSEDDKQAFIASKIEDMFATMFRQNMFARFEIQSHKMIQENGGANWEELSELYKNELEIMFGDSVKMTEEYKYEWASIPHIFNVPFYVYAYNFANLMVIALYEKYKQEGKSFVPKYKELLRSGGKDSPEKLLEKLGINLKERSFWEKGFDFVERELINKLK